MPYQVNPNDIIKIEKKKYHGRLDIIYTYVVKCKGYQCNGICRIQKCHLKKSKGLCKRCVQKGPPYRAKYNELVKTCRRRNLKLTLTFSEFLKFTRIKTCHYCFNIINWEPFTKTQDGKIISRSYNLDRKNNNLGYTKQNCVVCCWKCNSAKGNRYSYEEWFAMTSIFRKEIVELSK